MDAPDGWLRMGRLLFDGFHNEGDDIRSSFQKAFDGLGRKDRHEIARYLEYLTAGTLSKEEQLESWISSGADVVVPTHQVTDFLLMLSVMFGNGANIQE